MMHSSSSGASNWMSTTEPHFSPIQQTSSMEKATVSGINSGSIAITIVHKIQREREKTHRWLSPVLLFHRPRTFLFATLPPYLPDATKVVETQRTHLLIVIERTHPFLDKRAPESTSLFRVSHIDSSLKASFWEIHHNIPGVQIITAFLNLPP